MPRGIVDLILENKRKFYTGEIRNKFFEELDQNIAVSQNFSIISQESNSGDSKSLWKNLRQVGQKISDELFYENVK